MRFDKASTTRKRNNAFLGLTCALLGLVLLESAHFFMKANLTAHTVSVGIGVALIVFLLRHLRTAIQASASALGSMPSEANAARHTLIVLVACTVIAGTGYIATNSLLSGFVTPYFLFVAALGMSPWHRIASTLARYAVCSLATLGGVAASLLLHGMVAPSWLLIAVACSLWLLATVCWISLIFTASRTRTCTGNRQA